MKYRTTRPFRLLRFLARSLDENGLGGAIVDTYRHLDRSLRSRGIVGTLKNTFRDAAFSPREEVPQQPHPFDLLHGTHTSGNIPARSLTAISLSGLYSTGYVPILPSVLTRAISDLPVKYEDFNFVDLGCGKGRALLVAAQFPFRHLMGVELAEELCEVAAANVATNPDWIARISIVNQDATTFNFPKGPLLLYLYNPFRAPVLRRVLQNLEKQLRRFPRQVYILYGMNPRFTRVLNSFPFVKELSDTAYRVSPEEAVFDNFHRTEERFTVYSVEIM